MPEGKADSKSPKGKAMATAIKIERTPPKKALTNI
jgi:hypothetical protein